MTNGDNAGMKNANRGAGEGMGFMQLTKHPSGGARLYVCLENQRMEVAAHLLDWKSFHKEIGGPADVRIYGQGNVVSFFQPKEIPSRLFQSDGAGPGRIRSKHDVEELRAAFEEDGDREGRIIVESSDAMKMAYLQNVGLTVPEGALDVLIMPQSGAALHAGLEIARFLGEGHAVVVKVEGRAYVYNENARQNWAVG